MKDLLEYFRYLNDKNWGSGSYQWMFYTAILLVFVFEKKKIARIVFGWLPLVFLFAIYNPLFNKFMRLVFPNPDAYYVRMFSFIPVTYGIGVGFMQIITKTRGWLKPLCVSALMIIIVITGTDVYHALGMTRTANPEKVPAGLMEVIEAVRKDEREKICVAVPYPLSTSIRQIDSGLITPYGRDEGLSDSLHRELSQSVPDVQFVMNESGKRAVDYIVVYRNDEVKKEFQIQGYEPWGETSDYIVYNVSNVPIVQRKYDELNHIVSVTNYDINGEPIKLGQGYTTVEYQYDSWGYRIQEKYLDENGDPFVFSNGYCSVRRKYRFPSGLVESQMFLDQEDKPLLINGRYETRYTYNFNKQLVQEDFYDAKGNPMNLTDKLFATRKIEYNRNGQIIRESYFDLDGQPVLSSYGYAAHTFEYDDERHIVIELFYGTDGKATADSAGHVEIKRQYDDRNNLIRESYTDGNGALVQSDSGFSEIHFGYDAYDHVISESYWDEKGNPAMCNGYHRIEKEYNENMELVEERKYDVSGNLVL